MLSGLKLAKCCKMAGMTLASLAEKLVRPGLDAGAALSALKNWKRGLYKPRPTAQDIENMIRALGVSREALVVWSACHKWAPITSRKARLVTDLIQNRPVQDALDILKFTNKRAAVMVDKVLRSAIADADEQEADLERLYVCEARVDEGGIRKGTRQWRPKDRGRAVSWLRHASHIHVTVDTK